MFKAMFRGLGSICRDVLGSWAIPNLADSSVHMHIGFENMTKNHSKICHFCKQPMTRSTAMTFDIPQAYEEMDHDRLVSDASYVLRQAEKTQTGLRQVFSTAKALVGYTKSFQRARPRFDTTIVATKTIFRTIRLYLSRRLYRIGNIIVEQKKGVPIGGFGSGALLHLYLGCAEDYFDCCTWPSFSSTFGINSPRNEIFCTSRYEDDLSVCSHICCPQCLQKFIKKRLLPKDPN